MLQILELLSRFFFFLWKCKGISGLMLGFRESREENSARLWLAAVHPIAKALTQDIGTWCFPVCLFDLLVGPLWWVMMRPTSDLLVPGKGERANWGGMRIAVDCSEREITVQALSESFSWKPRFHQAPVWGIRGWQRVDLNADLPLGRGCGCPSGGSVWIALANLQHSFTAPSSWLCSGYSCQ